MYSVCVYSVYVVCIQTRENLCVYSVNLQSNLAGLWGEAGVCGWFMVCGGGLVWVIRFAPRFLGRGGAWVVRGVLYRIV